MTERIALCADSATLGAPGLVGLDGEAFEAQAWLVVFSSGTEARKQIAHDESITTAWVVSADDVDGINLAAVLKRDRPTLRVYMIRFDADGSFCSRAHTASIDGVLGRSAFVRCYFDSKKSLIGRRSSVVAPEVRTIESDSNNAIQQSPKEDSVLGRNAFVLPVVSGSGGVGKSAVAALGAIAGSMMGFSTLLLDYDLQFGDAAEMLGVRDALALEEAIAYPASIEQLRSQEGKPALLAAPAHLEDADVVVGALPELLVRLSGRFDLIVANTGGAWAEQHALLLERSNAALFLVGQRASSIQTCKHALELCSRCGIATGQFRFAVNRCAKNALYTALDVSCALRGAKVSELRDGGREVEECLAAGCALELARSGNAFYESVEHVLAELVPGGMTALEQAAGKRASGQAKRRGVRAKSKKRSTR